MGKCCAAKGCGERSKPGTKVSFHTFPSNLELRKKWLIALNLENSCLRPDSRVCSRHFKKEDYWKRNSSKQKRLLENVVPNFSNFCVVEEHSYALRSPTEEAMDETQPESLTLSTQKTKVTTEKKAMNETQLVISATQPKSPTQSTKKSKITTEKTNPTTRPVAPILPVQNMKFVVMSTLPTQKTEIDTEKEAMNETQLVTSKTQPESLALIQETEVTTETENVTTRSVAPILPVQNVQYVVIPTGVATVATTPLIKQASIVDNESTGTKKTSKGGRPLPVYFGDFKEADMLCPKKASKMFKVASETIRKQRALIRTLRTKSYRYFKRIKTLKEDLKRSESSNLELTLHLKNENMFLHKKIHVLKSKLDQVTLKKGSEGVG